MVWQQELEGIPVFEAVLIANFTRSDALVSLSSQVVPDLNRAVRVNVALLSAVDALALAARNTGEEQAVALDFVANDEPKGADRKQKFSGEPIASEATVSLVWLPMDRTTLRICWRVVLRGQRSERLFQVLVDAASGEVVVRHCWTSSAIEATYLVFDKDSAAPMLPGWSTPMTNQAPVTTQVNLTLSALFTNASPAGWVNTNPALFGLTNTTFGNNVDAHLDWTDVEPNYGNTTSVSLPRPTGVLTNGRVEFTGPMFTADFNQHPTNSPNRDAAVVNAFYWCNWMHDVLYELGFTEGAGNFQYDNFGRGGTNALGCDPVQMDVQDTALGISYSTAEDGEPGHIEVGIRKGRDASLDTTIILHEYTHLLVWRLVGGGLTKISAWQSLGLAEGWADFYALALLSESTEGAYPVAGYFSYKFLEDTFAENYYFGLRPYPLSTDMAIEPLTFGDLGDNPNLRHPDVPCNPNYTTNGQFGFHSDVHAFGQVWGVALWDARANLIQKHGFTNGNWLTLQLATDGMRFCPPSPTFLEARDALFMADFVNTGGANALELWAAFAKRGMGFEATNAPSFYYDDDYLIPVGESSSIPPLMTNLNGAIYSSPASDGQTIYVGTTNGQLHAVSREGLVRWSAQSLVSNLSFNSSPALSPTGAVYIGCNDSNLYAFASSGALLWRTNLGGAVFSSPALASDGTVYVGSGNGYFYAVNPDSTVKWPFAASPGTSINSSPAVALDGTIYIGTMTSNLYALRPTDGSEVSNWPVLLSGAIYSSPAIGSDGSIYVGGLDGKVYAFTTNGTPKSGWPVTTGGAIWSSPAIGSNGVVYIGSTDSNLYAINPNGTTNWTYKTRGAVKSSPALGRNGTVFVGSDDGNLHAVNSDGTFRWSFPLGRPIFSSPVIDSSGMLYVGAGSGYLYGIPAGNSCADGPWPMFRQNFHRTGNAKTLILRTPKATNGILNLEISGPVGAQCDVEVATNFPPTWSFLTNLTLTTGVGAIQTSSTNSQRYYRATFTN